LARCATYFFRIPSEDLNRFFSREAEKGFAQGKLEGSIDEEIGLPGDLDGDLNSGFSTNAQDLRPIEPLTCKPAE
jgi:hypothetical protein